MNSPAFSESHILWEQRLEADFGFDQEDNRLRVLNVQPEDPNVSSIFGVHVQSSECIREANSVFESWKCWMKVQSRFCGGIPNELNLINGPYFLRAAQIWSTFFHWCEAHPQGPQLQNNDRGLGLSTHSRLGLQDGMGACRALYAFYRGQDANAAHGFLGRLKGEGNGMYLRQPLRTATGHVVLGSDLPRRVNDERNDPPKMMTFNPQTGALMGGGVNLIRSRSCRKDDLLVWLEEYAHRLVHGVYQPLNANITLYPNPSTTTGEHVSRSVTQGVQVVASAVYSPVSRNFLYSIRVRMLTPGEPGYRADRGFKTIQIHSRSWQIHNDETNQTHVNQGGLGSFPTLFEGGYQGGRIEPQVKGDFSYESHVEGIERGSLSGHLTVVPGRLSRPEGPPFTLRLAPFALNSQPDFVF